MSMMQPWRSTVALWSEMALAPSRMARAQARATLRMMEAASPWRMRIAAGTLRTAPDGEVRAAEAVVTLPRVAAPVAVPAPVEVVVEPVTADIVDVEASEPAAAEPEAAEVVAHEAEHLPHGALAEASPLAVAAATAEEALTDEALAVEPPEVPAPLAVLAEPAAETLETAALEPILAMAEAAPSVAPMAKGRAGSTARKPRARRG